MDLQAGMNQSSAASTSAANVYNMDFSGSEEQDGTEVSHSENESVWNKETLDKIIQFAEKRSQVKADRKALSDQLSAAKSTLIAMGFNGDAMEAAIKYSETEDDKRENFDLSYLVCRKALGHPVQDDLFVAAMREQVSVSKAKTNND